MEYEHGGVPCDGGWASKERETERVRKKHYAQLFS